MKKFRIFAGFESSSTYQLMEYFFDKYKGRYTDFEYVFQSELDSILKNNKEVDFNELLNNLYQVYPQTLLEEVRKRNVNIINTSNAEKATEKDTDMPPEHVANREWRFTPESVGRAIDKSKYNKNVICCLGTPTLFEELLKRNANALYLDVNKPLIEFFKQKYKGARAEVYDVHNKLDLRFIGKFDTVFIDPPWQLEYYNAFTKRAMQLLKKDGGNIIIALMAVFSRPKALKDLESYAKFLKQMGVRDIEHYCSVNYDTPKFERMALEAANVPIPKNNWRDTELITASFDDRRRLVRNTDLDIPKDEWIREYDSKTKLYTVLSPNKGIMTKMHRNVLSSIRLTDLRQADFYSLDSNNVMIRGETNS